MRSDAKRDVLPVAPRIGGIVCQMRHTSCGRRHKVAHRISESENLQLGRGCNVWIRTAGNCSDYLSNRLPPSFFVGAKSHWMVASRRPTSHLEPLDIHSAPA
jgi:hypothetical protein